MQQKGLFVASSNDTFETAPASDPAKLLPDLLDHLVISGQLAQQLNAALDGNSHRPELLKQLIKELDKK